MTDLRDAGLISTGDWQPRAEFVQRVSKAYRLAIESYGRKSIPRWFSFGPRSAEIHAALLAGDESTRKILSDPGSSYIFYGMDNLFRDQVALTSQSDEARAGQSSICLETLQRLAAAVCPLPEGSSVADPEVLIGHLDAALRIHLDFPNPFPGEAGLRTSRGIISYRAPQAVFQSWRLLEVCKIAGGNKVLEIGAGMGRTVYYARRLGITDYTVVDLPATLVGASCFLAAVLGEDAIWVFGDAPEKQAGRIRLVPPTWLSRAGERFDVALNVDSLTDSAEKMPSATSSTYPEMSVCCCRSITKATGSPSVTCPARSRSAFRQPEGRMRCAKVTSNEVFLFSACKPKRRPGASLRLRWLALRPLSVALEARWQRAIAKVGPLLEAESDRSRSQQRNAQGKAGAVGAVSVQLEGAPRRAKPRHSAVVRAILSLFGGRRPD